MLLYLQIKSPPVSSMMSGAGGPAGGAGPGPPPGQARPPGPARPEDAGRQVLAKPRDLMPGLRDKWGAVMREAGGAVVQAGRERQPGDQQQNRSVRTFP